MTWADVPRGTVVETPNGLGRLWEVEGNKVTVEMDYRRLVEYDAEDVKARGFKEQSQEQRPSGERPESTSRSMRGKFEGDTHASECETEHPQGSRHGH